MAKFETKDGMFIFPCAICEDPTEMPSSVHSITEGYQYIFCPKCKKALKAVIENEQLKSK